MPEILNLFGFTAPLYALRNKNNLAAPKPAFKLQSEASYGVKHKKKTAKSIFGGTPGTSSRPLIALRKPCREAELGTLEQCFSTGGPPKLSYILKM